MITLRTRIFAIISVVVLVILLISVGLIWYSRRSDIKSSNQLDSATTTPETNQTITNGENVVPTNFDGLQVQKPTTEEVEKNAVKQLAKIFIERYASYSTDNDFQNIKELQGLITDRLWSDLSKKINSQSTGGFVGVTTRAIATNFTSWDRAKEAVVAIQVVQTEVKSGQENTYHKNVDITLTKFGDQWFVDKFAWVK